MVASSESDSDIEIVATKENKSKILQKREREEAIKDLEDLENQEESFSSRQNNDDINISISKSAIRSAKNMNITISMSTKNVKNIRRDSDKNSSLVCIDSDDDEVDSGSKLKLVVSEVSAGKRKSEQQHNKVQAKKFRNDKNKSTSEIIVESSTSMSTSEMVLRSLEENLSSSDDDSGSETEQEKKKLKPLSVQQCTESFLRSCKRILPTSDYSSVSKKIIKHLNKVDPAHHYNNCLKTFLDTKWSLLDSDQDNIFVHVKEVIEEIKKYKGDNVTTTTTSGETTSDFSETDVKKPIIKNDPNKKKRVGLTTLSSSVPSKVKSDNLVDRILNKNIEDHWDSEKKSSFCNDEDEKLLISLSLEKKSPEKVCSTSDKTQIQIFNKNLTHSTLDNEEREQKKNVSDKHIIKLEKALQACAKEIEKCEEAEIDWDNDDDSNFVMADKWKQKFMKIYNKLAQYKGKSKSLDRSSDKRFKFSESKYPEINKKIEKFVNKTQSFPDFWDIKKQIEKVNDEKQLNLTDMQMHNEAEKIFIMVGKKLKKRRNIDDGTVMYSYLREDDKGDPAAGDVDLDLKLQELGKVAEQKINKVFEDYAEKQAAGVKADDSDNTEPEEEDEDNESDNDKDGNDDLTLDDVEGHEDNIEEDNNSDNNEASSESETDDNEEELKDEELKSDTSSGSINNLLEESDHD